MTDMLWIDLETRSRVDLKTQGMYRYVCCPDFKILMASFSPSWEDPVWNVTSMEDIHDIPGLWDPSVIKVAHNAPFERVCLSVFNERHRLGMELNDMGFLPPEQFDDTMSIARELGYPASLSKCAKALGADPKDEAGSALIAFFCKPNRKGEFNRPEDYPEKWAQFIAYCDQDVYTLKDVHRLLLEQGGWPTEMERAIWLTDQRINDRGLKIDMDLAEQAVLVGQHNQAEQKERVREITAATGFTVENAGSIKQLGDWLDFVGEPLPNMQAETIEKTLVWDLPDDVREVLELRQELALAAPAKFASALKMQVDGRLHGCFGFFGAHTGRWAGRGTQPHNMPRLSFTDKDPITGKDFYDEAGQDAAILDLLMGLGADAHTLKKLVRPMFTGPLTVIDYKAIEAVVIAWLAGEEWVLQAFRDGRDIYVETANRMGGLTRAQGKIAVLALGFNGGAGSLKAMATDKDVIDIDGVPTMLARVPDDILYERFVWPWRDANPKIVRLWKMLDARFRTGGAVGEYLSFEKVNGNRDRLLRLPSGRAIAYRKAGISKRKKWNPRKEIFEMRDVLTFSSPARFPGRDETYGGRLAENATQAVARDLLGEALVRLEAAGYPVVLHVHDEVGAEGQHDIEEMGKVMFQLPDWAQGMPVMGEGFTCRRYRKG